jgi:leucyl-tRNA synthetase
VYASSRSYGLGTSLPWDSQYVIESSGVLPAGAPCNRCATVEYAISTVDSDRLGGSGVSQRRACGSLGIDAGEMNDHVWRYILHRQAFPEYPAAHTTIPQSKLDVMRNEFEYWYPVNLRVSGKDPIPNHLTMSLYHHATMWPNQPAERWPTSFYVNGHVMVDSAQMAKSAGNFITLAQAVAEFGADATRFSLADAADGLEDANFERATANATILKLSRELAWHGQMAALRREGVGLRTGAHNFDDRRFYHSIQSCIVAVTPAYDDARYRDALKAAFHEMVLARDAYIVKLAVVGDSGSASGPVVSSAAVALHSDLFDLCWETLCILLTPICPHFAQQLWETAGFDTKRGVEFVVRAS